MAPARGERAVAGFALGGRVVAKKKAKKAKKPAKKAAKKAAKKKR